MVVINLSETHQHCSVFSITGERGEKNDRGDVLDVNEVPVLSLRTYVS